MRKCLIAALLCFVPLACTPVNQQQASQALSQVQSDIAIAQGQLAALKVQLAAQQAVLTTQPANAGALKAENQIQSQISQVQSWILKAQPVVDGLQKAINTPAGQAPDTSFLAAFGPWGALAGILASFGYGAYQQYQKGKAQEVASNSAKQVDAIKPAMDHIQEVTQTTTPVAAAAAVSSSVAPTSPGVLVPDPNAPKGV